MSQTPLTRLISCYIRKIALTWLGGLRGVKARAIQADHSRDVGKVAPAKLSDKLIEVWQADAAGRYVHGGDRHPAPLLSSEDFPGGLVYRTGALFNEAMTLASSRIPDSGPL
jgi:hypothetical protein